MRKKGFRAESFFVRSGAAPDMRLMEPGSAHQATKNSKVLIIEDNLTNRAMLEDVLRSSGYVTMSAVEGKEGLRLIKEWGPSVVLLDLVMPGMGGADICREIRGMSLKKRPSVIIVSVKGDKETVVDLLSKGADDFIVKPFNESELIARVKAQLRISYFYQEAEEDKRNLETLLEITRTLSATLDPEEVLKVIVGKVAEAMDALRCSIVLIVKSDEGYVLASHDNPEISGLKINLNKYPEIKEVINTRTPLVLDDMVSHPLMSTVNEQIKGLKDMSLLIVPIVFNDEVLGTLFLRTRRRKEGFVKKEIDFCRIVANSSFHAIRNAKLFEKVTKEKEYLKEIAVKDHLTSLYNHNFFYSRLEEEFERAIRYEAPLSLIMMDIDDFKRINDSYGHRAGDEVLKEVSTMIKRGVRKTDILARYGGEEFVIILTHTPLKGAIDEAERLRELIQSHSYAGLIKESITLSFGVAAFPHRNVVNSGDLVNHADDALYKAKRDGKNCVRYFNFNKTPES